MRATRLQTRFASSCSLDRRTAARAAAFVVAALLLTPAVPAQAEWEWPGSGWEFEGSKTEDVLAKGLDAVIVRPLASARVLVGGIFFLPAALLSAPSGKEGFDGAYDLLIDEPIEYAFERKMGQF